MNSLEEGNKNLLKMAEILMSVKHEDFSMEYITWPFEDCNTPACAMGHYAADPGTPFSLIEGIMYYKDRVYAVFIDSSEVREHFCLTHIETIELFDSTGCGGALNPKSAAHYIRAFVDRRIKR